MVVGWDPNALIPAIDRAVESGVPVVCVDADVPGSKRLAFIGTDWYDLGVRQGEAVGVEATPTLYFNDRKYEGPLHPKYIVMWIDEELAVNR